MLQTEKDYQWSIRVYCILLRLILNLPGALEKYVKILEEKFKNDTLKQVYAGVNGRDVDDPEMQAFFKFKCWI